MPDAAVTLLYDQNDGLGIWKGDDAGNVERIDALSGWRPSFGPAGTTRIVLASDVDGWGVYVADDYAGTGLRKVVSTTVQAYVSWPVWSAGPTPNGQTMIAYVDEDESGYQHVYVTTEDGHATQITFGNSRDLGGLSWNPVTHDQLAVRGSDRNVYVLDLDADANGDLYCTDMRNVTEGSALEGVAGYAAYSLDALQLVFTESYTSDVWTYNLSTATFANLTLGSGPRLASNPEVCRDGRIVLCAAGKRDYVLYRMEADGADIREYGNTKPSHAQFAPAVRR